MMESDFQDVLNSYEDYLEFLAEHEKVYGTEGPPVAPKRYPVLARGLWIKDLRSNSITLNFHYMQQFDGEWYVKFEADDGGIV